VNFHKINEERDVQKSVQEEISSQETAFYTMFGKHEWLDEEGFPRAHSESLDTHAKSIVDENKSKFFVKRGRYGKLFNPIGIFSEGTSGKQLRHAGRPEWQFKEASKETFDFYIRFLKTKNSAWLHNAERE
tara:strand:+ start:169 stop:561 length:393 start_codon:yes stop_codon:yes gene_type:complete